MPLFSTELRSFKTNTNRWKTKTLPASFWSDTNTPIFRSFGGGKQDWIEGIWLDWAHNISSTIGWKPGLPWRTRGFTKKTTVFWRYRWMGYLQKKEQTKTGALRYYHQLHFLSFSLTRLVKDNKTGFTWKALDHYGQRFGTKSWVQAMARSKFN